LAIRPERAFHGGAFAHLRERPARAVDAFVSDDGEQRLAVMAGGLEVGNRHLERQSALGRAIDVADDQRLAVVERRAFLVGAVLTFRALGGRWKVPNFLLLYHLGPGERPLAGFSIGVHVISFSTSWLSRAAMPFGVVPGCQA